jgi:hypothetical protein
MSLATALLTRGSPPLRKVYTLSMGAKVYQLCEVVSLRGYKVSTMYSKRGVYPMKKQVFQNEKRLLLIPVLSVSVRKIPQFLANYGTPRL